MRDKRTPKDVCGEATLWGTPGNSWRELSPSQRPLCFVGRLGRKKTRACGKQSSPVLSMFSIIAIFIGIPSGSLCGGESGVGVCRPVLQILTLFHTKKCHFPHPFSDQISISVFRPGRLA